MMCAGCLWLLLLRFPNHFQLMLITFTRKMMRGTIHFPRFLEKAAIILPEDDVRNTSSWTLCSVQQVEAAKFVVRVLPIGANFIICTIVSSVGNTFFVEQGSHMNRNLGKWKVLSQMLLAIFFLGKQYFWSPGRAPSMKIQTS